MPSPKKTPKKLTERPTGHGKRLTISEKFIIYAEKGSGQSYRKVADQYGVHFTTVKAIWKDERLGKMKSKVLLVKESMADECLLVASECVNQVGEKISEASAKDAAISAGILIEKYRLLTDQSTANVNNAHAFIDSCNDSPV